MTRRKAFLHAVAAHEGQLDKSGEPYIFHPLEVERRICHLGEDFQVVALLHDVWEDTDYELKGLNYVQKKSLTAVTQKEREHYFPYIRRCREDFIGRVVKWADLLHNLSPERMASLPIREADSLARRYRKAMEMLAGQAK